MSNLPTAEFDQYSGRYEDLVNDSVSLSGESSAYFAAYKAEYLSRCLGKFSGTMLDYGCGVGLLAGYLRQALPEAKLDGYDPSVQSIVRIAPATRAQGVFSSELDDLSPKYDVILLANVMHHVIPGNRLDLILLLSRRLNPKGKIFIFEHNPRNPLTRRTVEKCVFDKGVTLLKESETRQYLVASGFRRLRMDYIVFFPKFFSALRPFEPYMRHLSVGAQYVYSAELGIGNE